MAAAFEREYGCTETEWLRWLPGAVRDAELSCGDGHASVRWPSGSLQLRWQVLPPRQIALVRMPRLHADFDFGGTDAEPRAAFLRYFDLYLQRGGG